MAQVATAEILLKLNTREYDQQLTQVQRQFSGLSKEAFNLQVNTRDADLALQTTLGLVNKITGTLKSFGQSAVGEFRAFSGGLQGFQAISGATAEELDTLKQKAIELGIQTTKSPTQVAQAATAYARLGKSVQEATEDLPGLIQLSESVGGSLEDSAQVTATATKIFSGELTSLQAANIITATTTNTAAGSVQEFNQVLSKAAGLAKANKVPFDELTSTFGLLRDSGSSAEVAGTAVRNILQNLVVPSEKAKKKIAELGLQVRDESGQFVGLRNVIEQLRISTSGLSDEARDVAISDIFGARTSAAITSLLALDKAQVDRVFDSIANSSEGAGVAAETAEKRLQGLNKTLTLLEGTTQTTKAAIGESLAPALNLSATATLNLLNFFLLLPKPLQQVTVGVGALTAGIGSLIASLSALRAAQQADTFAKIGLSAGALKETLSLVGAQVQGVVGKFGALGSVKVGLPQRTRSLSVDEAIGVQSAAIAERAAAAQTASLTERAAKEAEFVALKKQLASQEAALEARRIARDETASVAAKKRAAAEAGRLKASANIARIDAESARASAATAAADLQAAAATEIAATAEVKKATVTKASTASELFSTTVTKGKIALTKSLTFATDVLTVALGRKKAADVSATAAAAAGALQLAVYAGAVLVVVENLKVLGVIGDQSAKQLREFRKELAKENPPPIKKSDLGLLDQARVGFDQFANNFRKNKKTEEESINSVTSAAQKERQEREANALFQQDLLDLAKKDAAAIKARNEAILEGIKNDTLSTEQRAEQAAQLEEQLKQKQREIELAKASGLEGEKQIALLENQAAQIQNSIDLLQGKAVVTREEAIANEILTKSIKDLRDAYDEVTAAGENTIAQAKALTAERQLAGEINESEALREVAKAEQEVLRERVEANQALLKEAQDQLKKNSALLSEEDLKKQQKEILGIEKEGYGLRLELAQSLLKEQKRIEEERIKVITDAEAERFAEIEKSVLKAKKLALQEQLSGVSTAKETQEQITDIETQAIRDRLDAKRESLLDIQSAEDLSDKKRKESAQNLQREILRLETEIAEKQVAIREKQIADRKAAAQEAIQVEKEKQKILLDLAQQELDFQKKSLSTQLELIGATQGLADAQTELALLRLNFAKENVGSEQETFALTREIFETQKRATLQRLEVEKRSLDIKIAQQRIDSQIAATNAQIAILEAQAAIAAAEARGASEAELSNLRKVLELKQNILGQTEATAKSQEALFKIQQDTLAVNAEIAQEKLAQDEFNVSEAERDFRIKSLIGGTVLSEEDIEKRNALREDSRERFDRLAGRLSFRPDDEDRRAATIAKAAIGGIRNERFLEDLQAQGGISKIIGDLASQLKSAGVESRDLRRLREDIGRAETSQDVVDLLRQLLAAIQDSNRPNISVNSATPIDDVLAILRANA